jgi:nucleoid DNA-binding protein
MMSERRGDKMRQSRWIALFTLLGALAVILGLTASAQSQRPATPQQGLKPRVATASKLDEADVQKMLDALGPAIRDMIRTGAQVDLPGLGTFRVVRIPEHRDLVAGRPATIAASNYVEFVPTGDIINAANGPGAVPADTVPPFEYIVNPGQAPGLRTGPTRQPGTRTR